MVEAVACSTVFLSYVPTAAAMPCGIALTNCPSRAFLPQAVRLSKRSWVFNKKYPVQLTQH